MSLAVEPSPQIAPAPHRPTLRAVVRHIAVTIATGSLIPSALFSVSLQISNVWAALVAALLWCYGLVGWRIANGRRTSALLWLAALGLTAKTVFAFASGSTLLYVLQPVLSDLLMAVVFAVSLWGARPVVSRLAGDFYPMDDDLHARPRIRTLFRRLTIMWAAIWASKAALALWWMDAISVSSYTEVKSLVVPIATISGATISVFLSYRVARHEGLLPARA
jgi:uncharacterized membrane protein